MVFPPAGVADHPQGILVRLHVCCTPGGRGREGRGREGRGREGEAGRERQGGERQGGERQGGRGREGRGREGRGREGRQGGQRPRTVTVVVAALI